jgi:undecaprenyl-phosphate 4-deoxy-4-formamido-L-arabinose transferase
MSTTLREEPGTISVVVPVYGDGRALDDLAARVRNVLAPLGPWELIFVNDGSPPSTWDRIARLAGSCPSIKAIDLQCNAGQHNALLAGIRASTGGTVVTMDDDLQHPPEAVPALLQQLTESGGDLVYGVPSAPVHGHRRSIGGTFTRALVAHASGVRHARVVSAFRAFRGTLRAALASHDARRVFIDGMLCRAATTVGAVPVRHDPRRHGRSGYGLRGLIAVGIAMAAAFGIPRTRVIALCAGGALAMTGAVVIRTSAAAQRPMAGALALAMAGTGGAMLCLGLAFACLARHAAAARRETGYAIRTTINLADSRAR